MKRLHFFAVSVIIVLTVPQMGNSSVSTTKLKQWGELISSLDSYFIQNSDILAKKKPAISGWQSSEPKLVKIAPSLIKPDYQYEFENKNNLESSLVSKSPSENLHQKNLNIHTTRLKHEFNNTIDIPRIEVE